MTPQDFVKHLEHTNRGVRRLIERAPEDRFAWAPKETMMPLGQLCGHLATLEQWHWNGVLTGDWKGGPVIPMTKADILKACEGQEAYVANVFSAMEADEFFARTVSTPWGVTDTLEGHALFLLQHATHHRTQLFLYLKQLGHDIGMTELWT